MPEPMPAPGFESSAATPARPIVRRAEPAAASLFAVDATGDVVSSLTDLFARGARNPIDEPVGLPALVAGQRPHGLLDAPFDVLGLALDLFFVHGGSPCTKSVHRRAPVKAARRWRRTKNNPMRSVKLQAPVDPPPV